MACKKIKKSGKEKVRDLVYLNLLYQRETQTCIGRRFPAQGPWPVKKKSRFPAQGPWPFVESTFENVCPLCCLLGSEHLLRPKPASGGEHLLRPKP
jgi:hypothetical protein